MNSELQRCVLFGSQRAAGVQMIFRTQQCAYINHLSCIMRPEAKYGPRPGRNDCLQFFGHDYGRLVFPRFESCLQSADRLGERLGTMQAHMHALPEQGPHMEAHPRRGSCASCRALREGTDAAASRDVRGGLLLASIQCTPCSEAKYSTVLVVIVVSIPDDYTLHF